MKDLYRRNNLRARESEPVRIHAAAGSPQEREAAFGILLNAQRKQEYDQAHLALSRIGYLRRHMGLAGRHNWRSAYADFLETDVMGPEAAKEIAPQRRLPWRRILGWMLIVAVLVVALTPLGFLLLSKLFAARLFLTGG